MVSDRQHKLERYRLAYDELRAAIERFPREMWQFRPTPDRWTIHETIIHIADSEANSFVRCRRLIAEPGTSVMGYDENVWANRLGYHTQSIEDALELFRWLRHCSYTLIVGQPEAVWSNTVEHSESGIMTMDDWLDTYSRHVSVHVAQMEETWQAWRASRGAV